MHQEPGFDRTTPVMQMIYRITADLIVLLHAGFALFVVIGLVLILLGAARGWSWVRNIWFRGVHLIAIGTVVGESWFGIPCPLTVWERRLRNLAGETAYEGDFIAHWTHELLFFEFPPWVFTSVYTLFGLTVLATLVLIPPRRTGGRSPSC
ncbi:MAG: DUF2784 domain-containing protein [Planctomycetaceae bacterium]